MSYTPPLGNDVDFSLLEFTPPAGSAVDFELAPVSASPFFIGFYLRKKLGKPGQPDPLNVKGIYQMRMTKTGKRPIKMKFYTPTNPQTVPQQANRQKFADAMTAWLALTDQEKTAYNVRAKRIGLFGKNLFIREYYQAN